MLGLDPMRDEIGVKSKVGYVPEKYGFYEYMRVKEIVAFVAAYHNDWNYDFQKELMSEFALNEDYKVKDLSKGMRAKLALLMALSFEPEMLLLDEPAGGLDPAARRNFIETILSRYQQTGKTIVLSSHLLNEFSGLIDHVAFIKDGGAELVAPVEQLQNQMKRVRVVFDAGIPNSFALDGIISTKLNGREAVATFENFKPEESLAQINAFEPSHVFVEDLSLEDIFVARANRQIVSMVSKIFYKELKRATIWLLAFPFLLADWFVASEVFSVRLGWENSPRDLITGGLTTAFVVNTLIAIVVGIAVISDERAKGTDAFLLRLPISKMQILREKLLAGSIFLFSLYLVTAACYWIFMPEGAYLFASRYEQPLGSYYGNLFLAMFSGYVVAVLSSFKLQQPLAIFLVAFIVQCSIWIFARVWLTDSPLRNEGALIATWYLLIIFGMPVLLVWKKWNFSVPPSVWGTRESRTLFKGLVWKHIAQDGMLYIISIGLLFLALVYGVLGPDFETLTRRELVAAQNSFPYLLVAGTSILLPIALGANAYGLYDGQGLNCALYNHPISRTQLFVAKMTAALPILAVSFIGLLMTLGESWPVITLSVWILFSYFSAIRMSLWLKSIVLIILSSVSWCIFLAAMVLVWMQATPEFLFFGDFEPVNDYRIIAAIPLALIALGTVVSAWHMATNRHFLAGSDRFKVWFNAAGSCAVYVFTIASVGVLQQFVTL